MEGVFFKKKNTHCKYIIRYQRRYVSVRKTEKANHNELQILILSFVEDRIMAPKDIHVLIPRTCECVSLYGRRVFTDVIEGTDLKIRRLSRSIQVGPT